MASGEVVEQIIRPDRSDGSRQSMCVPAKGQVDNLLAEVRAEVAKGIASW